MTFQQIQIFEIERAAARQNENPEQVRLPTHLLHELPRHMQRRMREQMNDDVALLA